MSDWVPTTLKSSVGAKLIVAPPNPGSNLLRFDVLSVTFTVTVSLVLAASLTALTITVSAPASSLVTTTTAPDGCPVRVTVCVALPLP